MRCNGTLASGDGDPPLRFTWHLAAGECLTRCNRRLPGRLDGLVHVPFLVDIPMHAERVHDILRRNDAFDDLRVHPVDDRQAGDVARTQLVENNVQGVVRMGVRDVCSGAELPDRRFLMASSAV